MKVTAILLLLLAIVVPLRVRAVQPVPECETELVCSEYVDSNGAVVIACKVVCTDR